MRQKDRNFLSAVRPLLVRETQRLAKELGRCLVMAWVGMVRGIVFFVRPSGDVDHITLPNLADPEVSGWMRGWAVEPSEYGWSVSDQDYRHTRTVSRASMDGMQRT